MKNKSDYGPLGTKNDHKINLFLFLNFKMCHMSHTYKHPAKLMYFRYLKRYFRGDENQRNQRLMKNQEYGQTIMLCRIFLVIECTKLNVKIHANELVKNTFCDLCIRPYKHHHVRMTVCLLCCPVLAAVSHLH